MKTINLTISGMTCDHCAITIEAALTKVQGVNKSLVSYINKSAQITAKPEANLNVETLINTVQEAGYSAELKNTESSKLDNEKLQDKPSTASLTKAESEQSPLKIIITVVAQRPLLPHLKLKIWALKSL